MKLSTAMIVSATVLSFPAEVTAKKTNDKFEAEAKLKVLEMKMEREFEAVDEKMDEIQNMRS